MSLKIMIAGCAKDERAHIESSVKDAFGGRADEALWNVSLVNVANQWSIEIDGPEPQFKGLSFVAAPEDLAASVRRALKAAGAAEAHPQPSPPTSVPEPVPAPVSVPVSVPPPPLPGPTPPRAPTVELQPELELEPDPDMESTLTSLSAVAPAEAPVTPSPQAPAPLPLPKPSVPPAPLVDGDRKDRHQCEGCQAPFDVFYYAVAGERMERCPVACPSCWHVNNVPIASGAGLNGDYRAQAAS